VAAIAAFAIGLLGACGVYLLLRAHSFSVALGLTLLSYAVNLLIFAGGRLYEDAPPLIAAGTTAYADPLPQALVLTAIVIAFGMTAYLLALALAARGACGNDHVDGRDGTEPDDE